MARPKTRERKNQGGSDVLLIYCQISIFVLATLGVLVFCLIPGPALKSSNQTTTKRRVQPIDIHEPEDSFPVVNFTSKDEKPLEVNESLRGVARWMSLKPDFECQTENLVGIIEDVSDSRWTCGLDKLSQLRGSNCLIYSFGLSSRLSFEVEVLNSTACSLYLFDHKKEVLGPTLSEKQPRVHFHKLGISEHDTYHEFKFSLKTILKWTRHAFIDILKVNAEGWELAIFRGILKDFPKKLPVGQLILDIYNKGNPNGTRVARKFRQIHYFIRRLKERGMEIYHVDPLPFNDPCCASISFVNKNHLNLFQDFNSVQKVMQRVKDVI